MATGDASNSITSTAASAQTNFQPAAGVEIAIITLLGETAGTSADIYINVRGVLTNGTDEAAFYHQNANWEPKILITNTLYLGVKNLDASTKFIGYSGMQTK